MIGNLLPTGEGGTAQAVTDEGGYLSIQTVPKGIGLPPLISQKSEIFASFPQGGSLGAVRFVTALLGFVPAVKEDGQWPPLRCWTIHYRKNDTERVVLRAANQNLT